MFDYSKEIEKQIKARGYGIVSVFGDDCQPSYSYTVGLHETYRHPEIITAGLPAEVASGIIENCIRLVEERGGIETQQKIPKIASGFDVIFEELPIDVASRHMLSCNSRYNMEYRAIQLYWPDPNGIFPWQRGFNLSYAGGQMSIANRIH